jgi:ABC-type siderophore export system fused ATPase/permease subunit
MLNNLFKNISIETQGIFAFVLGMILVLGTLGKLQILQGILNSVMIVTGLVLLIWGLHASKGINKIQDFIKAKK